VLGRFMQSLEGDSAQAYNLRKDRSGAFWTDRYHAVMIDGGEYLWRCLRYIDLNMVRAGVVTTPADWPWCGYQELTGLRRRYRAVDLAELAEALAPGHPIGEVVAHYGEYVATALREHQHAREAYWTESVAVGTKRFVGSVGARIEGRMHMRVETTEEGVWMVREERESYSSFSASKNAAKGVNQLVSSS
jgi:putative transposase